MEIMDIKDKVGHSHECTHKDIKQAALQRAADETRRPSTEEKVVDVAVDASHLLQHTLTVPQGIPRTPAANRYVLHIFSGARREGDLQSPIMDMIPPDGTTLFPVSIDVVLSELLDTKQQCQWLTWARQGAIHLFPGFAGMKTTRGHDHWRMEDGWMITYGGCRSSGSGKQDRFG